VNYAEQLEEEAYRLARRKLVRALEGTQHEDRLDGYLARLDIIHAEAMRAAAAWNPPKTKLPPLTATNVSSDVVIPAALARVAEAQSEEPTE